MKHYLSQEHLQELKDALIAWRDQIQSSMEDLTQNLKETTDATSDTHDAASLAEEFGFSVRTYERDTKLLAKINHAILRLDRGQYGYCEVCHQEIGYPRLKARLTAELCIECKRIQETKEQQSS